jgi:hypothetical protein
MAATKIKTRRRNEKNRKKWRQDYVKKESPRKEQRVKIYY